MLSMQLHVSTVEHVQVFVQLTLLNQSNIVT
mgnify:CR=1 FL=1